MRIRVIDSLLLAAGMVFLSTPSFAQVGVSVMVAPPELPVYQQPMCPGDGYLWTPGYWAWGNDYYWVPGAWIMPPEAGYLWTPGYWGWGNGGYFFNEGYWGVSVGFYGGIDYGFGYFGRGYEGGRWDNGRFFYNTRMNNVNRHNIHNVYNTRVNETVNRVSYNGGTGGINSRATSQEDAASHDRHIAPSAAQTENARVARSTANERFPTNHGAAPEGASRSNAAVHPRELPAIKHQASPNTGDAKRDQKYQKQQDKLVAKQNQDRQRLQGQQDKEHQQLAKQAAAQERTQQVEQRHQQQTQQLQQTHAQQTQHMEQRQSGGGSRGGESRGGGGGGGHR